MKTKIIFLFVFSTIIQNVVGQNIYFINKSEYTVGVPNWNLLDGGPEFEIAPNTKKLQIITLPGGYPTVYNLTIKILMEHMALLMVHYIT